MLEESQRRKRALHFKKKPKSINCLFILPRILFLSVLQHFELNLTVSFQDIVRETVYIEIGHREVTSTTLFVIKKF